MTSTVVDDFEGFEAIGKVILRSYTGFAQCKPGALTAYLVSVFKRKDEGRRGKKDLNL